MGKIFTEVSEKEITRTIAQMFNETLIEYSDCDVIIIGAGPAGLMAGRELCKNGILTLIIEQNNYIGGGYWVGGYMMNPVTVRYPANKIWDELGVPYRKISDYCMLRGDTCMFKPIASACDCGELDSSLPNLMI
jgi:thiamine thiazole synthase